MIALALTALLFFAFFFGRHQAVGMDGSSSAARGSRRPDAGGGEFRSEQVSSNAIKYLFYENGASASFERFFELLSDQESAVHGVFYKVFSSFPFRSGAVFWECAPITPTTFVSNQFEFILMDAPRLAERAVDIGPFRKKFIENPELGSVISFHSLGKDAVLVVPTPPRSEALQTEFTHLASFMRGAGAPHVESLWVRVGREVLDHVKSSEQTTWISTSGLGVSWLHVRLDSIPKYYNWVPYKDPKYMYIPPDKAL
jgi:hypothetical protein